MDRNRYALLNSFQRDFPLVSRPFRVLAHACGTSEAETLRILQELRAAGAISRVGAVVAPRRIGASTLGALRVPAHRLEDIAALVSALPEINHNYAREDDYNLWFVANAADRPALDRLLARIAARTGYAPLDLPLIEEYRIDLGFDLSGAYAPPRWPASIATPPRTPDSDEQRLLHALQDGLDIVAAPFRALGMQLGLTEDEVLAMLDRCIDDGIIRRFGVIVRHHELGFRANAMAVWDVPDAVVSRCGRRNARCPQVTLAYRRRRQLPEWPYNLFCMVHGKERSRVEARIRQIAATEGLEAFPHRLLFSTRRFKQCGARYVQREPVDEHG